MPLHSYTHTYIKDLSFVVEACKALLSLIVSEDDEVIGRIVDAGE